MDWTIGLRVTFLYELLNFCVTDERVRGMGFASNFIAGVVLSAPNPISRLDTQWPTQVVWMAVSNGDFALEHHPIFIGSICWDENVFGDIAKNKNKFYFHIYISKLSFHVTNNISIMNLSANKINWHIGLGWFPICIGLYFGRCSPVQTETSRRAWALCISSYVYSFFNLRLSFELSFVFFLINNDFKITIILIPSHFLTVKEDCWQSFWQALITWDRKRVFVELVESTWWSADDFWYCKRNCWMCCFFNHVLEHNHMVIWHLNFEGPFTFYIVYVKHFTYFNTIWMLALDAIKYMFLILDNGPGW